MKNIIEHIEKIKMAMELKQDIDQVKRVAVIIKNNMDEALKVKDCGDCGVCKIKEKCLKENEDIRKAATEVIPALDKFNEAVNKLVGIEEVTLGGKKHGPADATGDERKSTSCGDAAKEN